MRGGGVRGGGARGGRGGRVFDRMGPPPNSADTISRRVVSSPSNPVQSRTVSVHPDRVIHPEHSDYSERTIQPERSVHPADTFNTERTVHSGRTVHPPRQDRIVRSPDESSFSDRTVKQPLLNNPQKMTVTLGNQQRTAGRLPYIHG